jgi:hypothetical protein
VRHRTDVSRMAGYLQPVIPSTCDASLENAQDSIAVAPLQRQSPRRRKSLASQAASWETKTQFTLLAQVAKLNTEAVSWAGQDEHQRLLG